MASPGVTKTHRLCGFTVMQSCKVGMHTVCRLLTKWPAIKALAQRSDTVFVCCAAVLLPNTASRHCADRANLSAKEDCEDSHAHSPRNAFSVWCTSRASRKEETALMQTTAAPTGTKKPAGRSRAIRADSTACRNQDLLDCFSWSSTDAIHVSSCSAGHR